MMQATGTSHQALQAIWKAVRAIPRGQVSSYGTIAKRAGLPGRARLVGYAMKIAPNDLPWHRVVAAGGRIVFPKTSRQFAEQRKRLRAGGGAHRGSGSQRGRYQPGRIVVEPHLINGLKLPAAISADIGSVAASERRDFRRLRSRVSCVVMPT
jgi:methylated-DNA-protein-cysteine methyltransferase-like protein